MFYIVEANSLEELKDKLNKEIDFFDTVVHIHFDQKDCYFQALINRPKEIS